MSNQALQLVQHIVIEDLTLVLLVVLPDAIIDAQKVVAEGWGHKELLHHAVHVTDATEILETHVLLQGCALTGWLVVPLVGLLDLFKQRPELFLHKLEHQNWTLLDQLEQQSVSSFSALVVLGSGCCLLLLLF